MPSLKQIGAFYWSGKLGSFIAAANHLNTTQSNISKRIHDMEETLQTELFDRSKRAIRLTLNGQELMELSERLLSQHARILDVGSRQPRFHGPFLFGVLESVAITWLPDLIRKIKDVFPEVEPRPRVSRRSELLQQLRAHNIDLVIGPKPDGIDPNLVVTPLANLEMAWVASPQLWSDSGTIQLKRLAEFPLIAHGEHAAGQLIVRNHFYKHGITPNFIMECNSPIAQLALVLAGIGITFALLPVFSKEIQDGKLRLIKVRPPLPPSPYVAVHRADDISPLGAKIAELARSCCDFSKRQIHI